jgi:transporter family-2 protein
MIIVYFFAALLVGIGQPVQSAINAQVRSHVGDAAWATLVSILGSTLCILLYLLIRRPSPPASSALSHMSWWMWTGGVFGVVFVAAALLVTPRLGAGLTYALIVCSQLLASLILDQWGWIGLPVHHASPLRVLGVLLLLAGVVLIRSF